MPPLADCAYCRIARHEVPAAIVYEDDLVLAFLHVAPINPGHCVLAPRIHCGGVTGLPPATARRLWAVAPRLAQEVARAVDADGWNLHLANGLVAGQDVAHCGVHLVPRFADDGFAWHWRSRPELHAGPPDELLAAIAERLSKVAWDVP